MTQLVCAHRWIFITHGTDKEHEHYVIKRCDWCRETWNSYALEPRVVIGRLENDVPT